MKIVASPWYRNHQLVMTPSPEMCKNLIRWLQTVTPERSRSVAEISDGVAMYNVLLQISPEHFGKLASKIKLDVGSNWRLKASNLKKINESIAEYYQDVLNLQLLEVGKPDEKKLAEVNDLIQIGKMLRLIVVCAFNCDRRQDYITQIMAQDESLQQCMKQAIEQMEVVTTGLGGSNPGPISIDFPTVVELTRKLQLSEERKNALGQRIRDLEQQLNGIMEDKQMYVEENEALRLQLQEKQNFESTTRSPDNRRQMELLKEEIFKVETIRDDYRAKMLEQEKVIHTLQEKVAELHIVAETASQLQDEVDILSATAEKVQALEAAVLSYKDKLEHYTTLKKQNKALQEKNSEYFQLILKFEDDVKKQNIWKSQVDIYKNQVAELQQKLDEQTANMDKVAFMNKNIESKYTAALAEKDRLIKERDTLREENEEYKVANPRPERGAAMSQELVPSELKERLKFLEKENATLRNCNQDVLSKQALLEDALTRVNKLTESNRASNQRILELESQLEDQKPRDQNKEHEKIVQLQEALNAKEHELQAFQAKYNKSVEKAKEVASMLDVKANGSLESLVASNMKSAEEKLITSAFYKLSSACQREAADERVALLSGGQGQSFLSRQRQSTPRKGIPFKSK